MYTEDDLLPISALQHLIFCERQCALIHIEQAWAENLYTAEGMSVSMMKAVHRVVIFVSSMLCPFVHCGWG